MSSIAILDRVRALPPRPGVYIFRDEEGDVLYVGKAASLKSRVRSYFGAPASLELKTRFLSERIADFEYILTRNAQEALILEATLVKRHQPPFNIRLKDDKHYPYLRIDVNEPWPRVTITRRVERDGARYFGPYANAGSVRRTLDLVKKLFPWRSCTRIITGNDPRPCLDYYINRCIAPCTGFCTKEEYDEVIQQVILFLEGRSDDVIRGLTAAMSEASEHLDFERAARIRDQVKAVQNVTERQLMATTRQADEDVFGLARSGDEACIQVFFLRGDRIWGRDNFTLDGTRDESDEAVIESFLKQFYESATYIPKNILVPAPVAEQALIEEWLSERRGSKVSIHVPQRGERKRLIETAAENAREAIEAERVKWLTDAGKTSAALEQLADELNLAAPPRRIECYDISNTQGTNSVASMVVFIDGKARNSEYRRFKIKTVEGPNDFASMAEVLRRRFKRFSNGDENAATDDLVGWAAEPDLVIVDGGKGQLGAALDVMRDLNLEHIPLAGLAKENEELFVKDLAEPVVLPRNSEALYLVQRIRDEAHRFAITFHRQLRGKSGVQSALDSIAGVGPARKRLLLRKFGSVKGIREASTEEIAATPGMTKVIAERLKREL